MSVVASEPKGATFAITIDRPEQRNALNAAVADGIIAAIDAAEASADARVIVLTGRGDKAFCAGGDLKSDKGDAPFDVSPSESRNFVVRLLRRMEDCRLPIIARVNGHVLAGGLGLLCACDMAITVERAKFGTPEVAVGVFPMMILPFLQRVIQPRKLQELCFTGEPITAQEALSYGLVNHVVSDAELDAKVDALASVIASRSPAAIRLGKMGARAMRDMVLDQALEYAQLMLATMARTEDAREGMAAFREKRAPKWSGR